MVAVHRMDTISGSLCSKMNPSNAYVQVCLDDRCKLSSARIHLVTFGGAYSP